VYIRNLQNELTKTLKVPNHVDNIFYAGTGLLLLRTEDSVALLDIQRKEVQRIAAAIDKVGNGALKCVGHSRLISGDAGASRARGGPGQVRRMVQRHAIRGPHQQALYGSSRRAGSNTRRIGSHRSESLCHCCCLIPPAITLATKNLEQLAVLHETIRIKSGAWDDTGVFVYTTLNHLKYALLSGYVKLDQRVYVRRFPTLC